MKAIFLDIDGVLNNNYTKEKLWNGCDGINLRLCKMFLDWFHQRDYSIVLSSSWRHHPGAVQELQDHGIEWVTETPRAKNRGLEIQEVLDFGYIKKYVILDDLGPSEFLKHQRPYLVQTSFRHGLQPKKLVKMDELLGD